MSKFSINGDSPRSVISSAQVIHNQDGVILGSAKKIVKKALDLFRPKIQKPTDKQLMNIKNKALIDFSQNARLGNSSSNKKQIESMGKALNAYMAHSTKLSPSARELQKTINWMMSL